MDFPIADLALAVKSIQTTRAGVIAVYCLSIYEWFDTYVHLFYCNSYTHQGSGFPRFSTETELVCALAAESHQDLTV
jgi:hypothetical protein